MTKPYEPGDGFYDALGNPPRWISAEERRNNCGQPVCYTAMQLDKEVELSMARAVWVQQHELLRQQRELLESHNRAWDSFYHTLFGV